MTRSRWALTALVLCLALVVVGAGWWRFGHAVAVPTLVLAEGEVSLRVSGPGSVQARVPLTLASRLTAVITEVRADVGDLVRAGDLLVRLDARELSARLAAVQSQARTQQRHIEAADAGWRKAQADAALARSRLARDTDLQRQGFVSAAGLEAAQAAVQAADAGERAAAATLAARRAETLTQAQDLRAAEIGLSHTQLSAPFDALVLRRLVEPGSTVVPGSALLQLADPASIWVAVRVDEAVLAQVQLDQVAQIRLRSGETLSGRVQRIARQADAATREVDVFVGFDQPPARFAIDQEAEVRIATGSARGLPVPVTALRRDAEGRQGVMLLRDGSARFVPVQAGAADSQQVLVQGALQAGETLILAPAGVRDGMRAVAQR